MGDTVGCKNRRAKARVKPASLVSFGGNGTLLALVARRTETGETSIPIGENSLGFLPLVFGAGKAELHFPGSASDDHFDRGQTAPLHPQVELFVGFVNSVALETVHGSASDAHPPN